MSFLITERLHDFFRGDDAAWDDITVKFYDRMLSRLERKFDNLPFADLQDAVSDWVVEIFEKVQEERCRVEVECENKNFSAEEIAGLKIRRCSERIGFDAAKGTFENWMWSILNRRAIDCWRKNNRRAEVSGDDEPTEDSSEKNESLRGTPENPWLREISEAEFLRRMNRLKMFLNSVLEENELLYFQIWLEYGDNPNGQIVKEIFKSKLDRELGDATVTSIKKRFIRVSYLNLLEFVEDANALKDLFHRLAEASSDETAFFADMMKLIWRIFCKDANTVEESKRKISPHLWEHLETLVQRTNVQNKILAAAYRHFRDKVPRPAFCRTVEIYADNRFGKKVREFFAEGGGDV